MMPCEYRMPYLLDKYFIVSSKAEFTKLIYEDCRRVGQPWSTFFAYETPSIVSFRCRKQNCSRRTCKWGFLYNKKDVFDEGSHRTYSKLVLAKVFPYH